MLSLPDLAQKPVKPFKSGRVSAGVLQLKCLLREWPEQSSLSGLQSGFELPFGLVQLWWLQCEEPLGKSISLFRLADFSSLNVIGLLEQYQTSSDLLRSID